MKFNLKQHRTKEEGKLNKIHNRIQEYGLEEVAKVHRDDRFHLKKDRQGGGNGEGGRKAR
jgi:hypothetical protein